MSIKILTAALKKDRLSVEEKIEAVDALIDVGVELEGIEVFVKEPDDIDDEPPLTQYTNATLAKLPQVSVVAIANERGIDAALTDSKTDVIKKILDAQKKDNSGNNVNSDNVNNGNNGNNGGSNRGRARNS